MPEKKILLSHGNGGRLTHQLIKDSVLKKLHNPVLNELTDSAFIPCSGKAAFTTDSFVVHPLFFPGGDIGKLSVCGTVNDLVMVGARPEYLSLACIIEEGFEVNEFERIIDSIAKAARNAKVDIVTGDIKVVERGACDKIFITTAGIGRIVTKEKLSPRRIREKDKIIITGSIAEHGLAVLAKRNDLGLGFSITSDSCSLNHLLIPALERIRGIKCMRDPTRGGIATTLNELAKAAGMAIIIDEKKIPVKERVRFACELLGVDPLYLASEGRALICCASESAERLVTMLRRHSDGRSTCVIGEVRAAPRGRLLLNTAAGSTRIVDMLTYQAIPRIC